MKALLLLTILSTSACASSEDFYMGVANTALAAVNAHHAGIPLSTALTNAKEYGLQRSTIKFAYSQPLQPTEELIEASAIATATTTYENCMKGMEESSLYMFQE